MCFDAKTHHALVGCLYAAQCAGVDKLAVGAAIAVAYFAASAWVSH
ncbi:MAG: hypothetical protein AAF968_11035 [Pseudomonadota bacterium]